LWFQITSTPLLGIGNGELIVAFSTPPLSSMITRDCVVRGRTPRPVDGHPPGFGVGAQQRLLALRQMGGVLLPVGRVDREEHGILRERVGVGIVWTVVGRHRGDASRPLGNGALCVAGAFATDRSEVPAESLRLFGGDFSTRRQRNERDQQRNEQRS